MIKSVQKIGSEKSYIPDETLVNFIQDWLHIHKKRDDQATSGCPAAHLRMKGLGILEVSQFCIRENLQSQRDAGQGECS